MQRLQRMIAYASEGGCRRRQIVSYFGQKLASGCEGCDRCSPEIMARYKVTPASANRPEAPPDRSRRSVPSAALQPEILGGDSEDEQIIWNAWRDVIDEM
jgi:superfamily II DNA helicase RecQ